VRLARSFLLGGCLLVPLAGCSDGSTVPDPQPTPTYLPLPSCPVLEHIPGYVARAPYPTQPPPLYQAVWYGTDDLWVMLTPGGEVWRDLPRSAGGLSQKTFWWSRNFDARAEPEPAISVSGTRLDARGSFSAGNPGTHAIADFGQAMLVGVEIPSTGCWEITAEYKDAALRYVVLVE